jgi:hypothetical protein
VFYDLFQGAIRVRHFRLSVLLITILLAFAGSALADTVSMTFLGPAGNSSGGVYTYPYEFSVNGGAPVALICDAFDNEVVAGETWTATVNSLTSGNGLFGSQLNNYKAAGLIFQGIVNGSITDTNAANWAIWGLFSADATANAYYQSSGAGLLATWYQLAAALTPNSAFANLVLYTPVAGTQSWSGSLPQEYIGLVNVAEPAEIAMMLMLVIGGMLGFAFRQRLGLKLAIAQQA